MAPRLPHPSHKHRLIHEQALDPQYSKIDRSRIPPCGICHRNISADYYVCYKCNYYCHGACVEAPPQIDRHPLHPDHPLALIHRRPPFICDACDEPFDSDGSSFCCDECNFDLDVCCALSTLSDRGGSPGVTIPEQVTFLFHPHPLTSFSMRHDFVDGGNCMICRGSVEGDRDEDGYMCLRHRCKFLIHKRCIQYLYYVGGPDAPRVYHNHPLETFVEGEDKGLSRCASCGSDESGEFIGCASCQVFYHRNCIQAPEMIQYPPHPDHTLILFINGLDNDKPQCRSCSSDVEVELCYRCTSCQYFVHVGCSLKVLSYCEESMSAEINSSIHVHRLTLCHRTETVPDRCMDCWNQLTGPAYVCQEQDCTYQIHGRCVESESEVNHPYHLDHPLSFVYEGDTISPRCEACRRMIIGFSYSCDLCVFHLQDKCAARMPTMKHYLHEHELVYFDKVPKLKCNRCDTRTNCPLFRCVPCNFNLHEKCIELPLVVKHETHFHPLTLREFFREDDSGEYYCDLCEKRRDGRLGVYVCGHCELKMDQPWAFHIECVLPELQKVYKNKEKVYTNNDNTAVINGIDNEISLREDEICEAEEKLEEMKRELEGLRKKQAALTLE